MAQHYELYDDKRWEKKGRETKTFKVKQEVTDWNILENAAFS